MAELGTKGSELNLLIRQGATLGEYYMTVKTQEDPPQPIDLTGATFSAQIRKTADSSPLTGVTFDFVITEPLEGKVTWQVPSTSTVNIPCSEIDENQPESLYVWDMEVKLASGKVIPLTYGTVKVFREVTKVG